MTDLAVMRRRALPATLADPDPEPAVLARLNGVRLIVVTFIGLGYASTMSTGPDTREWLLPFGYDISLYGIQLLFFLSGWLAWRSLLRGRGAVGMLLSRARRTLPWLALYTALVAALLYPALCDYDAPNTKSVSDLLLYFVETVSLVDPGQPMPGALDNAFYACLLQGAIWTLQWGALAYVALSALWLVGGRDPVWTLFTLVILVTAYVLMPLWSPLWAGPFDATLAIGLRLAIPFLLGVVVYAYRASLPSTGRRWLLVFVVAMGMAAILSYLRPQTPVVELIAMTSFCALTMGALQGRSGLLENWPNLALPVFLGVWPTAQTLLALFPDLSVAALVVSTLAIAIALATALKMVLRLAVRRLRRPLHRRVEPA